MVGIVWMVGMVCKICKSVGYGTGSVSQPDHFSSLLAMYGIIGVYGRYGIC